MKNYILNAIDNKNKYLEMLWAVSGTKTSYTAEEKAHLLTVYVDNAEVKFGFSDPSLLRLLLILDTAPDKTKPDVSPLAEDLAEADRAALSELVSLYAIWDPTPEMALRAKDAALAEDVSAPLAFALARSALDVLAAQKDLTQYRDAIADLAAFLGSAEEKTFSDATRFLSNVRERVR